MTGDLESRVVQQITGDSTKKISNRILQSSGSSNDHSEQFSYMKWPIGVFMILVAIPLGLKGEIWFKWLGIPLGVLIGCAVNRQIYSAVAQHVVMNDSGWQVAWLAFAVILSMIFGIVSYFFEIIFRFSIVVKDLVVLYYSHMFQDWQLA